MGLGLFHPPPALATSWANTGHPTAAPKIITARRSQPPVPRGKCWGKDGGPHCPPASPWVTVLQGDTSVPRGCSSSVFPRCGVTPIPGRVCPCGHSGEKQDKVPAKEGWPRDVLGPPGLGGPSGDAGVTPREQGAARRADGNIYNLYSDIHIECITTVHSIALAPGTHPAGCCAERKHLSLGSIPQGSGAQRGVTARD